MITNKFIVDKQKGVFSLEERKKKGGGGSKKREKGGGVRKEKRGSKKREWRGMGEGMGGEEVCG